MKKVLSNKHIKLKVYAKVLNSIDKVATLDGMCIMYEMLFNNSYARDLPDIISFLKEFTEVVTAATDMESSITDIEALRKWANKYNWINN